MPKQIALLLALIIFLAAGSPALAKKDKPAGAPLFDLTLFLAPPPAQDSAQTKSEIDEILKFQINRTPAMAAAAQTDVDETGFAFADVLGENFTPEKLPLTAALLLKVHDAEGDLTDPVKDYYHRPRPYVFDARVEPCVKKSNSFSYPSGHATGGTAMAVILAHMIPEKKDALLARGLVYCENRVIGGAHYRSDIVAGQRAGVLLAQALLKSKSFQKDYELSKKELRGVLGLN